MPNAENTSEAIGHGVRRLCVAIDLERYSQRPDSAQVEAQRAMSGLLREAGQYGALERAQWLIQPQGDGELALLPPGIDETYVITSLMRELNAGLHRYNRHASTAARLRMRVAVHEGVTYVAEAGFAGDAINTVCRLRDAQELKDALSATRNDLVLIVSARIYHDVICGNDAYDLPPASFRPTEVVMPAKGFRAEAFIYAGGNHDPGKPEEWDQPERDQPERDQPERDQPERDQPERDQPERGSQRDPAPSGGGATFNFAPGMTTRDIAGQDIYNVYQVRDE